MLSCEFGGVDTGVRAIGSLVRSGRGSFACVFSVVLVTSMWIIPVFGLEVNRDWYTYANAGIRLTSGQPLYAPSGQLAYLYPPGVAWLWAHGMSQPVWTALKLLSLAALAWHIGGREGVSVAVLLALLSPVEYDVLMGNVMVFYLVAVIILLERGGWRGSAPMGVVLALAAKPAIGPLLLWLCLRRPRDAGRVAAVAGVASLLIAGIVGAQYYAEYLSIIPRMPGALDGWTGGNVGLSRFAPAWAAVAVLGAYVLVIVLAVRGSRVGGLVAAAVSTLAQPSEGLYYGVFVAAALVPLRDVRRATAVVASMVAAIVVLISPVLATGVLLVAIAVGNVNVEVARRRIRGSGTGASRTERGPVR